MTTPAPAPQNVALLMPFAGIDQAEITADYSAEPKTSTIVGGPILTQAQRRGRYDVSGEFSTGGHIVTESHSSFDFGGQWVVEFWVFLPHAAIAGTVTQRPFLAAMDRDSNLNRLQFFLSEALPYPSLLCWSDATGHLYDGPVITWGGDYLDRWVHVVYQRGSDGRVSVFRDGILEGTGTNTSVPAYRDFITFNVSRAGGVPNSTSIMYLSDVRITCGEAFYPLAGFVPPERGLLYVPPTRQSVVSGVVQIDKAPAKRTVRAFGYNPTTHDLDGETINLSKSLGHATSDPNTGEYTIDLLAGYGNEIFVVAFDDYGADFTPDLSVAVGDRIHPTTPNGHVWECTGAGTLPSEEPTWVVDTETAQLYGTASMIAKPFYRPMVHGPVAPQITEGPESPSGPTPARYWRIYIYSNNGDNETGLMEVAMRGEAGGPNLMTGGTISASHQHTYYTAAAAIDGDTNFPWLTSLNEGPTTDVWLAYDFGEGNEVLIKELWIMINGPTQAPADFALQKSTNGTDWDEVLRTQATWTANREVLTINVEA